MICNGSVYNFSCYRSKKLGSSVIDARNYNFVPSLSATHRLKTGLRAENTIILQCSHALSLSLCLPALTCLCTTHVDIKAIGASCKHSSLIISFDFDVGYTNIIGKPHLHKIDHASVLHLIEHKCVSVAASGAARCCDAMRSGHWSCHLPQYIYIYTKNACVCHVRIPSSTLVANDFDHISFATTFFQR